MIGKYRVLVNANKVRYDFVLDRKFTIFKGNSATGKTYFHYLITNQQDCIITCSKKLVPIEEEGKYWRTGLLNTHNVIYIIDEFFEGFNKDNRDEFFNILKKSDNYFILITRTELVKIPYSVKSIYQLTDNEDDKYNNVSQPYTTNSIKPLYNDNPESIKPDLIITEDSGSGFQFFSKALNNYTCIASGDLSVNQKVHVGGKDNVRQALIRFSNKYDCICAIVDGAAFGSSIAKLVSTLKSLSNKNIYILMPESFEYLILKSKVFECNDKYLDETYNYSDINYVKDNFNLKGLAISEDAINSWEQFYTILLTYLSKLESNKGLDCEYSKHDLNNYYLRFKKQILDILGELIV